jgi:hypothetical protein
MKLAQGFLLIAGWVVFIYISNLLEVDIFFRVRHANYC